MENLMTLTPDEVTQCNVLHVINLLYCSLNGVKRKVLTSHRFCFRFLKNQFKSLYTKNIKLWGDEKRKLNNHQYLLFSSSFAVLGARGLLTKGKNGTNNCFVTIALGKEKFQTSIKDKESRDVVWREECEL